MYVMTNKRENQKGVSSRLKIMTIVTQYLQRTLSWHMDSSRQYGNRFNNYLAFCI